MKFYWQH